MIQTKDVDKIFFSKSSIMILFSFTFVNFELDIFLFFLQNVQMANMEETVYKLAVKIVMCPRHVTKRPVPAMVVVLKDGNYLSAIKVVTIDLKPQLLRFKHNKTIGCIFNSSIFSTGYLVFVNIKVDLFKCLPFLNLG